MPSFIESAKKGKLTVLAAKKYILWDVRTVVYFLTWEIAFRPIPELNLIILAG